MKPLSEEGIRAFDSRLDDAPCRNFPDGRLSGYFTDRCGTLIRDTSLH